MKRKLFLALIYFLMMSNPILASAKVWFVRPEGENYGSETGVSYTDAWDGISKIKWGSGGIEPGDTLYICGVHSSTELRITSGGSSGKVITVRGDWPGDPGVIGKGNDKLPYGVLATNSSYLTFYGLRFQDATVGIGFGPSAIRNITVDSCVFQDLVYKGIIFNGSNIDPDYQEDLHVRNCTFENIGAWGDTSACSLAYSARVRDTITENCTFRGNGSSRGVDGIVFQGKGTNSYNHVVRDCTFSGFEENGVDLKGGTAPDGVSTRSEIYGCDFSNSNQLEIPIHFGVRGWDIHNNVFHDGILAIGMIEHADGPNDHGDIRIYYNVFYNFSETILADGYATAYGNNTFINNVAYNAGWANSAYYSIRINTNNWTIKNNIFYHLSQARASSAIWFMKNVDMGTIDLDHNCHVLYQGIYAYRLPDDSYKTVAEVEPNGLQVDPQFMAPAAGNFRLKSTSPCIDAGTAVKGLHPTIDIQGQNTPKGSAPDIGAYEMESKEAIRAPANLRLIPKPS